MIIDLSNTKEITQDELTCKHKGPRFTDCQTNQVFCGDCGFVFCKTKEKEGSLK